MTPETGIILAPAEDLRVIETSAAVATPVAVQPPPAERFPLWLKAADVIHRSTRSPVAIAADVVTAVACAAALGIPLRIAAALTTGLALALYVSGKYTDRSSLETQGILWYTAQVAMPVAVTTVAATAVAHARGSGVGYALMFGAVSIAGLTVLRCITCATLVFARRRGLGLRRTLILGNGPRGRMVARKLADFPEAGLTAVSMLPLGNGHGFAAYMPEFPSAAELARAIEEADIEHVVLAPDASEEAILECVKGSEGLSVTFSILPPLADFFLHPGLVTQVGGLPLIPLGRIAQQRATLPGKRFLDILVASAMLLVLSPIMALAGISIKLFDRGPIFYNQRRVGRGGKVFYMLKFRSMVVNAERLIIDLRDQNVNNGLLFKVQDDPRITRVGRIIRRLSIDELPQLWNVIRGEMSLVGPRPLPVEPDDFGPIDNKRHSVLPGITGYWQVAGDHGLTYEEMIKLDLAYIENWSLWLDLRLLVRTVPALLHRRGPC